MMRWLLLALLLPAAVAVQASDDAVLLTVAGEPVLRSEFEQSYLRNNTPDGVGHQTVADYLELFIVYKLKVRDALDNHVDTTASFRSEYMRWRMRQPFLADARQSADGRALADKGDTIDRDSFVDSGYTATEDCADDADQIRFSQILLRIPQKARPGVAARAQRRIDSLYIALQGGADFADLARRFSDDEASAAHGGDMGWLAHHQMLQEVEDVAFRLLPGDMSRPFLSTMGYHILLVTDRRQGLSARQRREESERQYRSALRQQVTTQRITAPVIARPQASRTTTLRRPDAGLERDLYEGLLIAEQTKYSGWRRMASDDKTLAYYFKKNKKRYRHKGFKPKSYEEVRELVTTDLQAELEKHWIADLRQKYPVQVNQEVLKTIYHHN